jgi:hypothetical protein
MNRKKRLISFSAITVIRGWDNKNEKRPPSSNCKKKTIKKSLSRRCKGKGFFKARRFGYVKKEAEPVSLPGLIKLGEGMTIV